MLAPDGRLWFATRSGIVIADPAVVGSNRVPPPVFIEQMRVDGAPVALSGPLALGPGVAQVQFDLSARSFTAPEHVQIRHRLADLDAAWVSTPPTAPRPTRISRPAPTR